MGLLRKKTSTEDLERLDRSEQATEGCGRFADGGTLEGTGVGLLRETETEGPLEDKVPSVQKTKQMRE